MWEVVFFVAADGRVPVRDFLDSLPLRLRQKALRDIDLLECYGPLLGMPHARGMGEGLFELRVRVGSDISRIFYFFFCDGKIVLTNGFVKKSQRTPPEELRRARRLKEEYERRER